MTYYCPECRASTAFREGTIQHYDNCQTSEAKLQRRLATAKEKNERLRALIEKRLPKYNHDHSYYHDDCSLCQTEKENYADIEQTLKGGE